MSHQELSSDAQYAFGSLCEWGDILTCTAAHTHKSGNSPPPVAAATTAPAVVTKAVATVAVAMEAVVAAAAAAYRGSGDGTTIN